MSQENVAIVLGVFDAFRRRDTDSRRVLRA